MSIKFAARVAALICALLGATPLLAHEGHDHAAAPPVLANTSARAEAESSAFELVAVPRDGQLEIWLDRFATNEPVEGASIAIETPDGQVEAKPDGGVYRAPAAWAARPGRYDLIFTVSAGDDMDVLATSLIVPPPNASGATTVGVSAAGSSGGKALPYLAGLSLLFGAAIPILFRHRRQLWAPAIAACLILVFGAARLFAHEGHDHEA